MMNLLIAIIVFGFVAAVLVSWFVALVHRADDQHDWEADENESWINDPFYHYWRG